MRINRVFVEQSLARGARADLSAESAHYVGTVLRMRAGDMLHAFDGSGGCYLARIAVLHRNSVTIEPIEFLPGERESPLPITLAQGIARAQHMDYTVQKAVELGVHSIVPLLTEFSNVKLDEERKAHRVQHWRKVIIGACEQCGRNRLPQLLPPAPIGEWIARDTNLLRLALHPDGECSLADLPADAKGITILSGPEGGLAASEYEQALRAGYAGVRIGPRILRTETAAIAALAACQALWGDLR